MPSSRQWWSTVLPPAQQRALCVGMPFKCRGGDHAGWNKETVTKHHAHKLEVNKRLWQNFQEAGTRNWKPSRNETPERRIRRPLGFKVATNSGFFLQPSGPSAHGITCTLHSSKMELYTCSRKHRISPSSDWGVRLGLFKLRFKQWEGDSHLHTNSMFTSTYGMCTHHPCGSGQPQDLLTGWKIFVLFLSSRIIDIKMWSLQTRKLAFGFDFMEVTYLLQILSEGKISKTSS